MSATGVVEARRQLSSIGFWPGPKQLRLDAWLSNFDKQDIPLAIELLGSHVHLNAEHVEQAVASTIQSLSSRPEFGNAKARPAAWSEFLESTVFSTPLSRHVDATASGYEYVRLAKRLGIDEAKIHVDLQLIHKVQKVGPVSVVFLDDFAGTGTQFRRYWNRLYDTPAGKASLATLKESGAVSTAYYLPVVATAVAAKAIAASCDVQLVPAYSLDDDYSVLSEQSRLVTAERRGEVEAFLGKYSPRTGITDSGTAGYGDSGLLLSFEHSTPNNTIPVFQRTAENKDWKALWK